MRSSSVFRGRKANCLTREERLRPIPETTAPAIGVPGMARGDADVNVIPEETDNRGRMQGYLTPDQYLNYGYVPSQRYACG